MDDTSARGQAWLDTHWQGAKTCPICAQNAWAASASLWGIPYRTTAVVPVVCVTCTVCGYTMLLNGLVIQAETTGVSYIQGT